MIGALIIAVAATAITIKTLVGYIELHFSIKLLISLFVILSWFAPAIVGGIRSSSWGDTTAFTYFSAVAYFLFGAAFILLVLLLFRDFLWFGAYEIAKLLKLAKASALNPSDYQKLNLANIYTICLTFVLSFYACYEALRVPSVKEITLTSPKIKQAYTIVQLSDIHVNRTTSIAHLQKLVDKVNALNPDVILLTGDIGDDDAEHSAYIAQKLAHLESRYGRFVVMGNHEGYRRYRHWGHLFESLGMKVLYNDGTSLGDSNIFIAGITDPSFAHWDKKMAPDIPKALEEALPTQYRILMSHSPLPYGKERIGDFSNLFDLQISGHTHGGQIFPFHFLVKMANEYLAGLYPQGKALIYVSRGTGYWGPPMRLFAPSEITLFKIIPDTI